jgi:phage terminase small subunit
MAKKKAKKHAANTSEREDLELALAGFRDIAKQAATDLAKNGLTLKDNRNRTKVNPSARLFRDAVKTLGALRKQLAALDKETRHTGGNENADLSFLDE